jgi:hypothetical protein
MFHPGAQVALYRRNNHCLQGFFETQRGLGLRTHVGRQQGQQLADSTSNWKGYLLVCAANRPGM